MPPCPPPDAVELVVELAELVVFEEFVSSVSPQAANVPAAPTMQTIPNQITCRIRLPFLKRPNPQETKVQIGQ
jgi:hypothetical protein